MSKSEQDQLKAIRDQIDGIDQKIQDLINERAACAQKVASIKMASGTADTFYRPEREA